MINGKIVHVEKIQIGGEDRYVVKMVNSDGGLVWSSAELTKQEAIHHLLETGLPSWKIPGKFAEAEIAALAKAETA
jgi:hypothetical protein